MGIQEFRGIWVLRIVFNFDNKVKHFIATIFPNFLTSNDRKSVVTHQINNKYSPFWPKNILHNPESPYNGQYRNILQWRYRKGLKIIFNYITQIEPEYRTNSSRISCQAQITTRNRTFSSVRNKRMSLLLMFREHKLYLCRFHLIKSSIKNRRHARDIFQYLIQEEATTLISVTQTQYFYTLGINSITSVSMHSSANHLLLQACPKT
jgi:hypothetical protein